MPRTVSHHEAIYSELQCHQKRFPSTNTTVLYTIHHQAVSVHTHRHRSSFYAFILQSTTLHLKTVYDMGFYHWWGDVISLRFIGAALSELKIYSQNKHPGLLDHTKIWKHCRSKHMYGTIYLELLITVVAGTETTWWIVTFYPFFHSFTGIWRYRHSQAAI